MIMEFAGKRRVETLKALEKSMKRRGVVLTVLGLFLFLGAGFIAFLMFFVGDVDVGSIIFGIFLSIGSLFGLATLIFAFRHCFQPAKFQDVFDRAAELYGNIVYENDYFICSQRYIGSKINQFAIVAFTEILGFYEQEIQYRAGFRDYNAVLVTKRGDVVMALDPRDKETYQQFKGQLAEGCPGAQEICTAEERKAMRQLQKECRKKKSEMFE